jgi:hypothetical protein
MNNAVDFDLFLAIATVANNKTLSQKLLDL